MCAEVWDTQSESPTEHLIVGIAKGLGNTKIIGVQSAKELKPVQCAKEQVFNLAKTSIIQRAWKNEQRPDIHGWVYGLKDGIIKPVFEMKSGTHIDSLYEYEDL